jgi:hypothetical protein
MFKRPCFNLTLRRKLNRFEIKKGGKIDRQVFFIDIQQSVTGAEPKLQIHIRSAVRRLDGVWSTQTGPKFLSQCVITEDQAKVATVEVHRDGSWQLRAKVAVSKLTGTAERPGFDASKEVFVFTTTSKGALRPMQTQNGSFTGE